MGTAGRARDSLRHLRDAAGWHFGLGVGGWGGLLIATLLMATMYTAMVFSLAERWRFQSRAGATRSRGGRSGRWGFMTGTAILIDIRSPRRSSPPLSGVHGYPYRIWWAIVYLLCYLVFVGIHLYGVGEALKVTFAIAAIAVVASRRSSWA